MTGRIINLHNDPHREVLDLLPWHVTGQLDAADTARVAAHLGGCASCRAALADERQLDRAIVRMPASADEGWAALRRRLELDHPSAPRRAMAADRGRGAWWPGWARAVPLALASLLGILLLPGQLPARFAALGSAPPAVAGNLVVVFRPETSEAQFRQLLRASDARLIDGPTAANAYVLRVPPAHRAALLDRLRRQPQIVLAEPVDAAALP